MQEQCRALPGVREILENCSQLGWRIALASNSPGRLCHLVLRELGIARRFDAVISVDDVERGKPEPDIYLLAARRLGVSPAECLAFEDSLTGVRAAHAAGMRVVAISAQAFPEADVRPHLTLRALHEFSVAHAHELGRGT